MDFYINKGATLPVLKLELIQDGRHNFNNFFDLIQNANIVFSMTDVVTGAKRIGRKKALLIPKVPESCTGEEYYLGFKFGVDNTSVAGRFVGQFEIEFLDGSGTLIVPIREELFINILDGSIKK